jgi:hypothetical protein
MKEIFKSTTILQPRLLYYSRLGLYPHSQAELNIQVREILKCISGHEEDYVIRVKMEAIPYEIFFADEIKSLEAKKEEK